MGTTLYCRTRRFALPAEMVAVLDFRIAATLDLRDSGVVGLHRSQAGPSCAARRFASALSARPPQEPESCARARNT